jgi:hypothetical protein
MDSQYVDGDFGDLKRANRLPEPRDLDEKLAMVTVRGLIGPLQLTSITSINAQEAVADYDASPLASVLGTSGATAVKDDRRYHVFDQEMRLQNHGHSHIQWLAGLSLLKASTEANIVASDQSKTVPLFTLRRSVTEAALFGEATIPLNAELTVGGGGRVFSSATEDEGQEGASSRARGQDLVRGAVDASATWHPAEGTTIFLHAATGYRSGGINVEPDATRHIYEADELASVELGSRFRFGNNLAVAATLYAESWQHVQTDELLTNGLVATRNAGNARNIGVEADLNLTLAPEYLLTVGLMAQSAKLESSGAGIDDRRLPAVPQSAARLKLTRTFHVGKWHGQGTLGLRYVGSTHMSFDPVIDRRTGAHATADLNISFMRGSWTAAMVGENLTNDHSDTFSFGNPYRVRAEPQRTPTKPRTVGVQVTRSF